jgi:hypothetical protein
LPVAYWVYLASTSILILDAAIPSETDVSITTFGALLLIALLVGLTLKSNICRWALLALALYGAISLLLLQSSFPGWRDLSLMALYLIQAGLLLSRPIRLHTAKAGRSLPTRV